MNHLKSWDEVEREYRGMSEWRDANNDLAYSVFAAEMLAIIGILREEFSFEMLNAWRSLGSLILMPFPEKPTIHILAEKNQITLVSIYRDGKVIEEVRVLQEQLVPTVYEYLARLIRL